MRPRNSVSTLVRLAQMALGAAIAGSAVAQTTKVATVESGAVVAFIGDRAISALEVEARVKARMFKARQEAYDLQVEGIREVAFELMQEQEAAKLGLSREAYFKREVTDKALEPKDDEVQQIFTTYRSRLPGTDDEARAEVRRVLRERNANQRAETFKTDLLSRAKLRITLDPPRLEVPVEADDPVFGGAAAAVTLVEFSDFQCPYCSRANVILKQLRSEYGDRLKMVFKQLPLGIHPQARFAAEMALCANDQGKYWEAREWLFGRRDGMTPEAAKEWAKAGALDEASFAKCLDGHLRAAEIDADLATAESLAVESTPAFFVNGRMIQGARPIEQFREIIGDELTRATPRDPARATP